LGGIKSAADPASQIKIQLIGASPKGQQSCKAQGSFSGR
jgi:hypothetical protein